MRALNPDLFDAERIAKLREQFQSRPPFPNVAIENFLKPEVAELLYSKFPKVTDMRKHYKGLNENKAEDANFENYDEAFRVLKQELYSPQFIQWMEQVTGLQGVLTVDDHLGMGTHQGMNGSFLDVHIDFNIHPSKNLHRKANLLIFLNKNWKPEYGGELELWDKDVKHCEQAILPVFNRAAIFECSELSWHGYGQIHVPEGESRKSIYTYYYTPVRDKNMPYHDTFFKTRPTESGIKKAQTAVKENLKQVVKRGLKTVGLTKNLS